MTEEEWLACSDAGKMLEFIRRIGKGYISYRKLRLMLVACGRSDTNPIDPGNARAFEVAERFADGQATREELLQAGQEAYGGYPLDYHTVSEMSAPLATQWEIIPATEAWCRNNPNSVWWTELVREIFPFRPITVSPSWLTFNVLALADGIYSERSCDRMPILADALQDAGCDNDDILNHCRQSGEHVRGCWVVDLLTGRK